MVEEGKALVVSRDCFLVGALINEKGQVSSFSPLVSGNGATHPRYAQDLIRIPDLWRRPPCHNNQIDHPCHNRITDQHGNEAFHPALLAQPFPLLRLDKVVMLWLEVGFYSGCSIFEPCKIFQSVRRKIKKDKEYINEKPVVTNPWPV